MKTSKYELQKNCDCQKKALEKEIQFGKVYQQIKQFNFCQMMCPEYLDMHQVAYLLWVSAIRRKKRDVALHHVTHSKVQLQTKSFFITNFHQT